jgi:hypothetical protein
MMQTAREGIDEPYEDAMGSLQGYSAFSLPRMAIPQVLAREILIYVIRPE